MGAAVRQAKAPRVVDLRKCRTELDRVKDVKDAVPGERRAGRKIGQANPVLKKIGPLGPNMESSTPTSLTVPAAKSTKICSWVLKRSVVPFAVTVPTTVWWSWSAVTLPWSSRNVVTSLVKNKIAGDREAARVVERDRAAERVVQRVVRPCGRGDNGRKRDACRDERKQLQQDLTSFAFFQCACFA